MVQRDIEIYDIAIFQWSLIGNTVTDGLIDRSTDRLGEVHIIQRRWVRLYAQLVLYIYPNLLLPRITYVALNAGLVDNLVNVVCRDTWPHLSRGNIQDFSCKPANLPHPFLLFLVQNGGIVPTNKFLL